MSKGSLKLWKLCSNIEIVDYSKCAYCPGSAEGRSVQFSSVAQSCPTLCDPMDCSTPGFPVLHYLLEAAQINLCWPLFLPSIFPSIRSFPMSQLSAPGGQSTGVSASASVLPMNIQDWFPVGLTGLISLLSKGISRVFFSTIIWKHQFFGAQLSLWTNSHICIWLLGKP